MPDPAYAIPLGALIISVTAFLFTVRATGKKANIDELGVLRGEVRLQREELVIVNRQLEDCRSENIDLMRRVTRLEERR